MKIFLVSICLFSLFNVSFAFAENGEYAPVFQEASGKTTRELQSHIQSDMEKLRSLFSSNEELKYPVVIAKHSSEEENTESK